MRKTAWGLSAMTLSLLLGTIIAVGSLMAMGGRMDTEALTSRPLGLPTLLVTCLDPLAIVLEIAAIVLILGGSRPVGAFHRRLAWSAAILYVIWAGANLLGFLPLSFLATRDGSLALARAGQWIKAISAVLAYAVPALLVFGLSPKGLRAAVGLGLLLSTLGGFGSVALTISELQLEPITAAGQTLYVARFSVDYATGPYPLLLGISYTGGLIYLLAYGWLAWHTWQQERDRPAVQPPLSRQPAVGIKPMP
jgi:hypothetical protein